MSRWLAILEWGLTLAAAGVWTAFGDRIAEAPSIAAGLGWGTAWAVRRLRLGVWTRRTPIDWPLAAYLVASLVAVWPAMDEAAAGARIGLLLGAIGIFYALVNSSPAVTWRFGDGAALAGAVFALFFVTQHDWLGQPAKFAAIGRVGAWVQQNAPQLSWYDPHPNVAATILALGLPLPVAQGLRRLQRLRGGDAGGRRAGLGLAFSIVAAAAITLGLVMTESRGSAAAVFAAAGLAAGWQAARKAGQALGRDPRQVFTIGLLAGAATAVVVTIARPGLIEAALGYMPGPNSAVSRLEVWGQVWRLAQDTPYTGGGLAAFPGLYATHILGIPSLFLTHAHNAYLNVLAEQGVAGAVSFAGVFVLGGWAALRRQDEAGGWPALAGAGAAGIAVAGLLGLVDGPLVASRAAVLWLMPFGLALRPAASESAPARSWFGRRGWLTVLLLGLAVAAVGLSPAGHAAWLANAGALKANRVLLAGFPTNTWRNEGYVPALAEAGRLFEEALRLRPAQRTSHYYLGLIASEQLDFASAVEHLEAARRADAGHRGITKALAYNLVWLGQVDAAADLLGLIPEAPGEMEVYTWWWTTQQRPDLADFAQRARETWPASQ